MNREELRNRAAARRSAADADTKVSGWFCSYCSRPFQLEHAFMNHSCGGKRKLDQLQSPTGQAAYAHYGYWMTAQRHTVPPIETFATSRLFSTFIKFAEHVKKIHLPEPQAFIRHMVETGTSPTLWCSDAVFSLYLQAYDHAVPPVQQHLQGLEILMDLADELKVPLSQVFTAAGVDTLYALITKRKLTFWLLLTSNVFKSYLMSLPSTERDVLAQAINVNAAVERFAREPFLLRQLSATTKEAGL